MKNYSIPFSFEQLKSGTLSKVDVTESIRQHISLIITTPLNKVKFDPYFGSILHYYHLLNPNYSKSLTRWKEDCQNELTLSLKEAIEDFEPRLALRKITVKIQKAMLDNQTQRPIGKLSVQIEIKGMLKYQEKEEYKSIHILPIL